MLRRIRAALRSDRGEASAVSIVLGTLLFLTASGGTVAVVGNIMAATAVTRQNTIIEAALKDRVQQFLASSAGAANSSDSNTETVTYQGVSFTMTSFQGIYNAPTAIQLTVAAPMATAGGAPRADCAEAVSKTVPGCLSLSGTRILSPQDDASEAGSSRPSNVQAFPGLADGPMTIDSTQKALNIVTVTPSAVLSTDSVRVQVVWKSAAAPNTVRYGFYCGSNTTPQAVLTPTSQTYNGQVSLILELTPSSLQSVSGCTTASIGLSSGGAGVPASSIGDVNWWRILPATGGPE